ncbi:unnamed protein product [Effrenium voratum]|uniref:Uncharacterized protein n=1 Tax=Effrenium voratum TaxID=2562239 RepID=A0AA36J6Y8_9DINO|nr:unnamed protein product [Effrenium voratum]CAJ1459315.1 unnamed protein product [Effrenium voratum]
MEDEEQLTERCEVEKPLFYHGPRFKLCSQDREQQRTYSLLCYNAACDLVFAVEDGACAAYGGAELVKQNKDLASFSKLATTPKCRIPTKSPAIIVSTNEEGAALVCIVQEGGVLSVYSAEEALKGNAKEVYSVTLDEEEIVQISWKEDDFLCVCESGRTFLVHPQDSTYFCVHEPADFAPICAAAIPRSDFALLAGDPPEDEDTGANLWAVDLLSADSWPLFPEESPRRGRPNP